MSRRGIFFSIFSLLCAVTLMLTAMPAKVTAQPALPKLKIAIPGIAFLHIPLLFAMEKGYFQREGLDVSLFSAGRRDLAMKAVLAGEAFASLHDPAEAALARSKDAKVKIIAASIMAAANWMVGDRDITQDHKTWKGKIIALATPPNAQHSFFMKELRDGGWGEVEANTYRLTGENDPAKYLKVLYGTWGTDVSLILSGRANMTLTLEPGVSTLVVKGGKHVIKDYSDVLGPFLFSSYQISDETIEKDRETVQRFVNALNKGYRDAHSNQPELASVGEKHFSKTESEIVGHAIKNMMKSFPPNVMFSKASYQKNLEYIAISQPAYEGLKVKFEDVADTSFAEQAMKALK